MSLAVLTAASRAFAEETAVPHKTVGEALKHVVAPGLAPEPLARHSTRRATRALPRPQTMDYIHKIDPRSRLLLIDEPEVWTAPATDSATETRNWRAGESLDLLETRSSPDNVAGATTWCRIARDGAEGWVPEPWLAPAWKVGRMGPPLRIGEERVDRDHALPPFYEPPDLVEVGAPWNASVNYRLRREAAGAYEALIAAARADGIRLYCVSAYRSWESQRSLYARRVLKSGWDQQSVAKPGHSEHQLGTTVDFTDGDLEHLLRRSFGQTRAGRWLAEHAPRYGFAVSYTEHNSAQTGYIPEPWHYRYWGPDRAPARHRAALGH